MKKNESKRSNTRAITTAQFRTKAGVIGEMILTDEGNRTAFMVATKEGIKEQGRWQRESETLLIPIPASNNLLLHRAVLLPETATPYPSADHLLQSIGDYVDRFVTLSPAFRVIAIHYVLLTWVYDAFNELPYLRFRGEPGSGKTRALIVIGSICNRAFLASGASTVSPIFHTLDTFRGTFIFDEADFRFSDEKLELVKILNNGNVRGFPVFRSVATMQKQFNPQAFHVFGPKIVAMRHAFEDRALESRFLTEEMGQQRPSADIPISLPNEQAEMAKGLRNQLLNYRFQHLAAIQVEPAHLDRSLSPRMCQILAPLLAVAESDDARAVILNFAQKAERQHQSERRELPEIILLSVIQSAAKGEMQPLPLSTLTERFGQLVGEDFERPVTHRYIGSLLRSRLHLVPYKTGGVFVLPKGEIRKALVLADNLGLGS